MFIFVYLITLIFEILMPLFALLFFFVMFKSFTNHETSGFSYPKHRWKMVEKTACVCAKSFNLSGQNVVSFRFEDGTVIDLLVAGRLFDQLYLGDYGKLAYYNGRVIHFKKFNI